MPFKDKNRLIGNVFLLFLFVITVKSYAQINEQYLVELYRNHHFRQIKQALSQTAVKDSSDLTYLFFKTLFLKDGLQAKQNYERIFKQGDATLKKLAGQRLHDYYYAVGLYFKAAQYLNQLPDSGAQVVVPPSQKTVPPTDLFTENSPFKIQFGAFSNRQNAEQQRQVLQNQHIQAKVVKRKIKNRQFYCVWVNGLKNIEETKKFADQIKQQVHFDYRIIKP